MCILYLVALLLHKFCRAPKLVLLQRLHILIHCMILTTLALLKHRQIIPRRHCRFQIDPSPVNCCTQRPIHLGDLPLSFNQPLQLYGKLLPLTRILHKRMLQTGIAAILGCRSKSILPIFGCLNQMI